MKRAFIFLCAFLLLPLTVSAELTEYDFNGIWTCYIYEKDSETNSFFHLYQFIFDGDYCDHFIYDHYSDSAGIVLAPYETSHHYYQINGTDLVFKEYQTSKDIQFSGRWSSGFLYISFDGESWYKFTRSAYQYESFSSETVPLSFPADVYKKLSAGFEIPAGIYTIGIDIPSGDYSLSSDSSVNVIVKYNRMSTKEPTSFNMSPGSEFGKLTLADGNIFAISNGSVVLKTYSGLFN